MGSELRGRSHDLRAAACIALALMITVVGVLFLILNSIVVDDPGPSSGYPRQYLAVWPAGLVLLGVGVSGLQGSALVAFMRCVRDGGAPVVSRDGST